MADEAIVQHRGERIPLSDGVELRADVYRAADDAPRPVLLQYTAYNRSNWASVNGVIGPARAVESGFAVVVVDARGRFGSGGTEPFRPFVDDGESAAACVEWAARQPWSTGRVGMYGASNNGVPQWQALRVGAPGLRTIVPHFTATEFDDGWVWRGGAFHLGFNLWWTLANLAPDQVARAVAAGAVSADEPVRLAAALRDPDPCFAHLPLGDLPVDAAAVPHYREWLWNGPGHVAWQRTSLEGRWASVDVPVLHVAGWYNVHLDGNLAAFEAMRRHGPEGVREQQHLVIGPWTQWSPMFGDACGPQRRFPTAVFDMESLQLAWFAHHLCGGPDPELPRARVFVMGVDEWRDEDDWPPPGARTTAFHLRSSGGANSRHGDGVLSLRPAEDDPNDSFLSDPRRPVPTVGGATYLPNAQGSAGPQDQQAVEDRWDVLVYSTPPLDSSVTVIGPVSVRLFVASAAPSADVVAKLVDVFPDGRAYNLCDGILRRHDADGEVAEITIELAATANVFAVGHRIRLEIAGSNFPKFDRNPNSGADPATATAGDLRPALQTVFHDRACPSALLLPVL